MANPEDVLFRIGPLQPAGAKFGQPVSEPWLQLTQQDVNDWMVPKLTSTPAANKFRQVTGGVANTVFNPIETAMNVGGYLSKNVTQPMVEATKESWPVQLGQNMIEALTVPQGELNRREEAKAQATQAAADTADQQVLDRISAFDAVTQGLGSPGGSQVLWNEPQRAAPQLPAPPPGPDYSGVQDALDQTKPQIDEQALAERKKGAILTGLVGGLLQGALDGNMSAGQILGMGGMGTLQGLNAAGEDKRQSEEKFKKAMDEYWVRTAGVRRDQAESDAQYADRVYQTKIRQLELNAAAAQARGPKLHQAGDKFMVEETVNGQRIMRPLDIGAVNRLAGMEAEMGRLLGGTDDAKKKAGAIVAEVAARKDPAYALPMVAVARLKQSGKYMDLVAELGKANPEWLKGFNSIGADQQGFMDEKSLTDLINSRKDAMLIDAIARIPAIRAKALGLAGLDQQLLQLKKEGK